MNERRPSLSEGFGFASLSFATTAVLAIGTSILMARIYGIVVVGEFALATAPTGALWFLSTVREQPGFVRLVARLPPRSAGVTGLFAAVFAFSSALTIVSAALVAGGAYLAYEGPVGQPELFLPALASLVGYVTITNTGWNLDSVFVAFGDGRRLFWVRLNQSLGFLALLVALSAPLPSVWGPIVATIGSWAVALVHRLIVVRAWMRMRTDLESLRGGFRELPGIIKFGLKLTPGALAAGLSGQAAIWTVGIVATVPQVGALSRARSIGQRLGEFSHRIHEIVFPSLVRRHAAEDHTAFSRALVDAIRYAMVGMLLPAAIGGGASVAVMGTFGAEFEIAAAALTFLLLTPATRTVGGLLGAAVTAIDRPVTVSVVTIASSLARLAAIIPLTIGFGITGAALGTLAGFPVGYALFGVVLHRHAGIRLRELLPARQLLSVGAAYLAGFATAGALQDTLVQPLGLLVALIGGTAAYVAAYLVTGGPTSVDRDRAGVALARVRTKLRRERLARAA